MREEQIQEAPVKVLLVGVDVGEEPDFERSMEELASLAEAAEKEVAGQMVQRLDHVNKDVIYRHRKSDRGAAGWQKNAGHRRLCLTNSRHLHR